MGCLATLGIMAACGVGGGVLLGLCAIVAKSHEDAQAELPAQPRPGSPTDIGGLLSEYRDNEIRADREFKDRRIRVSGKVDSVENGRRGRFILLTTGKAFEHPTVRCDLNKNSESFASGLSKGDVVTVDGQVTGMILLEVGLADCDIAPDANKGH